VTRIQNLQSGANPAVALGTLWVQIRVTKNKQGGSDLPACGGTPLGPVHLRQQSWEVRGLMHVILPHVLLFVLDFALFFFYSVLQALVPIDTE
jgi:hypothetical protein